jgi:thymidylate synthase (FAD)
LKVTLLTNTPNPEKTVVLAAKLCYSGCSVAELEDKVKNLSIDKFLTKILNMGHLSVLEHANFTFGVDGISRATSHQLVRHRLASYSQQSQRYVSFNNNNDFVVPPSIEENAKAKERFTGMVEDIYALYHHLLKEGIAAEDARFLLPNAACTKIIITMNARELLHFFKIRCCERAQWEIRDMATRMLKLAQKKAPVIFKKSGPACVMAACSEGELTCGKPGEIRKKFLNL